MGAIRPCSDIRDNTLGLLRDAVKIQMGKGLDQDSKIMEQVRARAEKRFETVHRRRDELEMQLDQIKAQVMARAVDSMLEGGIEGITEQLDLTSEMEELLEQIEELNGEAYAVSEEDFKEVLSDLEKKGLLYNRDQRVAITSKGARILGQGFLNRVLKNLIKKGVGGHRSEDIGYGPWLSPTVRPYEPGDSYEKINIERSLVVALERGVGFKEMRVRDFRIHESRHATEVQFAVIVDQSASMKRKGKLEAAVETGLALNELINLEFPEDRLSIYAFSEETKIVQPWELPGIVIPQRYTDIRKPLRRFRLATARETGIKQVYLISDSAPNFLDGEFVGFKKALDAVLGEVRVYTLNEITLNVIMLDDDPQLIETAKEIAKVNNGRVFFTNPKNLGEAVIEDYLLTKRELLSFL